MRNILHSFSKMFDMKLVASHLSFPLPPEFSTQVLKPPLETFQNIG